MTIIRSNSISGINSITAAPGANLQFFDSTGASLSLDTGNVNAGVLTATTVRVTGDLTVEGTTTTLDTVVTEVDKLEVNANNSTVGVAITQSGAGDILRLYDGASQVVTVDDQGNFGIGVVTPIQKLHIGGSTLLSNNNYHYGYNSGGSQTVLIGITGSNNVLVGQNNVNHTNTIIYGGTGTIQFSTGGDERIRITSGGQLNINASSESIGGKVIIKNNVDYTATEFDDNPTLYLLNGDQTTGISEASIVFAGRNTGGSTYRAAISGNGSTGLKFYTTSNTDQNDDPAMIIRGSGNIGIGTNNPNHKLTLQQSGTSTFDAINIVTGNTNSTGYQMGINSSGEVFHWNTTNSSINFATNNTERMRLRGDGSQLLIGTGGDATYNEMTESADHSCVIIGKNAMSNGGLVIRTGNTGTGRIYFADNSGTDPGRNVGSINYYHNGDIMAFTAGGSNTMNMYAGNVRISGPGSTSGTSQSPLAVSSNLGTITAFFGAQTSVTGLTASQYSSAIRFNGADVAWGDIAYFPNGENEYGSFRFGRHGSTISNYPTASIGVNKVYTTGGIDFKTTTESSGMTSELFDDYEEGTFTPAWGSSSAAYSSPAPTYSVQYGDYTKVGNVVYYDIHLITTAWNGAAATMWVHGLPFTTRSIRYQQGGGGIFCIQGVDGANAISNLTTQFGNNKTNLELYYQTAASGNNYNTFDTGSVNEAGTVSIRINGFYFTNS